MRKGILVLLMMVLLQIAFAETFNVAVLSFERVDNESDYVANALMRRDMKKIFDDYDEYELLNQKEVNKTVSNTGYTNIFYLGREQIAEIGNSLNADLAIWGNVESVSSTEFRITFKIWTKAYNDIKQQRITVSKSSRDRINTIKTELIDNIQEMFSAEIDKMISIAMQHYNSQNWESAEEAFERILLVDPDSEEAYFYLGYINFRKDIPDYEKSEYYYEEGLKRNPENTNILQYSSATYLQQQKYEEAIDVLQRLMEIKEDKETWYRIGMIYIRLYEYDNALDAFDQAIALDNDYLEAHSEAGLLLYDELQSYEQAIPYLEGATRLAPEDENLQRKLARCYFQTNRLDSAIEQYKAVIESQPDRLSSYYNLARAYRQSGELDLALQTLLDLREKDSENPRLFYNLADTYLSRENYTEAIDYANQALEIDDTIYEPYLILARVYQSTGYQKYEEYLEIAERVPEAYGEEADRLTQQRIRVKEQAHDDFVRSDTNLNNAKERTTSASVLKDIERRQETLKKLLDATKKGFF